MTTPLDTRRPAARKTAPLWRSRRLWEPLTMVLIGLGLLMLMQPLSLDIYSYSFIVLLTGVLGYSVAGKLPE